MWGCGMSFHLAAVASLVALVSGWGLIHHARSMLFNGVGVQEGGGWAALILAETMVFLVSVAIALA